MLFARAVVAFLLLPGTVAYLVPLLLAPPAADGALRWVGGTLVLSGSGLLLWCVRDFYVAGKGTLAPWSPPRHLVTVGLYRWSRNPMYVAVLVIVMGWTLWFASSTLLIYLLFLAIAFHLRILIHEEPRLALSFGEDWRAYRARVARWAPRPGFARRRTSPGNQR